MITIKVIFEDSDRYRMMTFEKAQLEMKKFEEKHIDCQMEIQGNKLIFTGEVKQVDCINEYCFNYDESCNCNCSLDDDTHIKDCHAYQLFKKSFTTYRGITK